jgi:hypothetical protein
MTYTIGAYYRHEHNRNPVILTSNEDVDQLIDALLGETFHHTMAALYVRERPKTDQGLPDHNFRIGIDPERKLGSLKFAGTVDGTTGVWYAAGQTPQHDEVFYEYAGHPEDFPLDSEVSLDLIRAAVKEFLATGGDRPASVEWMVWPSDVA